MIIDDKKVKEIPGFPKYYITKDGKVYSFKRYKKGRWLSPSKSKLGYLQVTLSKDGVLHYQLIHRLVLLTFVGPCPKGMECCHNNGIPDDNRLENLRWDTARNNALDTIRHGNHKGLPDDFISPFRKLRVQQAKDIIVYNKWLSQRQLAKIYNVNRTTISKILKGERYKEAIL